MQLSIVAFSSLQQPINSYVKAFASEDVKFHEIKLGEEELSEKHKIKKLLDYLNENRLNEQAVLLVLDGANAVIKGNKEVIVQKFESLKKDIVFAADKNFNYPDGPLQYYYWKFYPRWYKHYNYLNSGAFIGKVSMIKEMLRDIHLAYHFDKNEVNPNDPYFSRYFVDVSLDVFMPDYKIDVDGNQELLAGAGGSVGAVKWPYVNWVTDHFLHLHEQKVADSERGFRQSKIRGLRLSEKGITNTRTKTNPAVLTIPENQFADVIKPKSAGFGGFLVSLWAYLRANAKMKLVFVVNRFSIDPHQTFRFEKHKNPDYESVMQKFLGFLERGEAFTFAHFNDGELNFIRKFLKGDHKKTWNGRIQDQYDVPLAERLLDSIKYQQNNYFIGVSCSTCGSGRRHIADELMGDYPGKIGAMVFHHNLRYLPKIISNMVNKEMFFVMNDYQKLDFLENLGVTVKEENKIKIPFVNSHKEYDNLKDRQFPEGSFVILMCGMLAKILIRNWYELNPTVTFIALGSTMDDFIQLSNTNYRPYPKQLPLTRNIHLIKSFLFGNKKHCEECYNI